jgi:hypothetical protein
MCLTGSVLEWKSFFLLKERDRDLLSIFTTVQRNEMKGTKKRRSSDKCIYMGKLFIDYFLCAFASPLPAKDIMAS